ncbi:MAG TPA: hypothetical protein VN706_00530 [Gemmatimonadaceae bacterium]|nr:hypothetical protein [Gemmatimonadaceae bacterium]
MADERKLHDDVSIASQSSASASSSGATTPSTGDAMSDPADAIPVPPAMSPAEIDERAQAVEAVRDAQP